MTLVDRTTGRRYQLVKVFTATGGSHVEARTGRRYTLVKRYL
jgi:hypothetical protein